MRDIELDAPIDMPPDRLLKVIFLNDHSVEPPCRSVYTGHFDREMDNQGVETFWYHFLGADVAFVATIRGGEFWVRENWMNQEAHDASDKGL